MPTADAKCPLLGVKRTWPKQVLRGTVPGGGIGTVTWKRAL